MGIARRITLSAAGAVLAVGLASPAQADSFEGVYTMDLGGDTATWTVTPCDPAQQPFSTCVHVAQTGGKYAPWQGDAYWQVGYWTMFVDRPDAITCDDGKTLPANVTYSWDAATLAGSLSFYFAGGCGDAPAASLSAPFTLTKT